MGIQNDETVFNVASFAAAGVLVVGLVALIYALVLRPSRKHAVVRKAIVVESSLPRHSVGSADHAAGEEKQYTITNANRLGGRNSASTTANTTTSTTTTATTTSSTPNTTDGSSSLWLFSSDDAIGLDWNQVAVASQRARKAKKGKLGNTPTGSPDATPQTTPQTVRKHLESIYQVESAGEEYATAMRSDTLAFMENENSNAHVDTDIADSTLLAGSGSSSSTLKARGSFLRAAAPSWTPSGGYMFSLGGTPAPSTPKKKNVHEWKSAPTKTGKNKRSKSQSHLITTPSRRTSVKNNPFAALEV